MDRLELTLPDDWHLHVRDGAVLADALRHTARTFGRALLMPNLDPPVRTVAEARAYRERVRAALPPGRGLEPLFTLYLTDRTTPATIHEAARTGWIAGVKLYPAGATTHSEAGVRHLDALDPVLDALAQAGLPLLVHGEHTDPHVDAFDREAVFLDRILGPLLLRHPTLRCVVEHATTAEAVAFVRGFSDGRVGCTLTPQHLLLNRNALFEGGLRPHRYCLPILKRERHRLALVEAAISGDPRFFLGTDSAPHPRGAKEAACGCAGCFTAPHALALYATAFERAGALDRLEAFASHHGADWYGRPRNPGRILLVRQEQTLPATFPLGDREVVPLWAGRSLPWTARPAPPTP